MRVKLPSNGCMGILSVDIRQPKIEDLREVGDLPESQALAKTLFVKKLMDKPETLDKCSIYDKEYLFTIVAGIVNLNVVDFEYQCRCGQVVKGSFDLSAQEVVELPTKSKPFYSKEVNGEMITYHIPTVKEEEELCKFIMDSDLDYDETYQDGLVNLILGNSTSVENLNAVRQLTVSIYYGAVCFYQYAFHGVHCCSKQHCSHCGQDTMVIVPVADQLLKINTFLLMKRFAGLAKSVDFASFKDLTIPELVALEKNTNE